MTHQFFQKLITKATLTFNLIKTWKQLVNNFQWKMLFNPDSIKQATAIFTNTGQGSLPTITV